MAALDVATGKVTGQMAGRHRSQEFLAFLDHVSEGIAPGTPVHVALDNVSSHKSAEVSEWLKDHSDWTFHFTPAPASWIERRRGVLLQAFGGRGSDTRSSTRSTSAVEAIEGYIEHHNASDARPFRWSKAPEDLVQAWKKGHQKLQESAS